MEVFDLERYLTAGVENIIKGMRNAAVKNPAAGLYMLQYANASRKAADLRRKSEERGEHIPPFLIASITNQCNLHCKGCYARANNSCTDVEVKGNPKVLTGDEWEHIFRQAASLGISFILLAGGEPFLRKDVLQAAGRQKGIVFPVFTNGTMLNENYFEILKKNRNLLPILSIEGNEGTTDERRGKGIFHKLCESMKSLHSNDILYGVSVTVHKENLSEVLDEAFLRSIIKRGCKAVIYVEYVPVDTRTRKIALDEEDRRQMELRLSKLRADMKELLFISFPGDEKSSGGCLAAGRGFFHINPYGGAEPCPFSPYSDTSLREVSLKEALKSPLFLKLKDSGTLLAEHSGGCVLYEQEMQVKELVRGEGI